jgi:hypothetical protein
VADRLESDHPVLTHLSGGFDSSCIALVAGTLNARVAIRAVGAIHPGLACDESVYMDALKARLPYPVEYWDGTTPNFEDLIDPALAGPARRNSLNSATRGDLDIAAREGARVLLMGYGGDIWGPQRENLDDYLSNQCWRQLWQSGFMLPRQTWKVRLRRLATTIRHLAPEAAKRVVRVMRRPAARFPSWLSSSAIDALSREPPALTAHPTFGAANRARLERICGAHAIYTLDMLHETASVAPLEKRQPFLDRRCVDLLWRLPLSIWRPPAYRVRFHARALADLLPVELLSPRPKTFHASVVDAKLSRAAPAVGALVGNRSFWHAERYLRHEAITQALALGGSPEDGRSNLPGSTDSHFVWRVVTLESWLSMVYGRKGVLPPVERTMDKEHNSHSIASEPKDSQTVVYEPPAVKALGNVHELLAGGGTQLCDGGVPQGDGTEGTIC